MALCVAVLLHATCGLSQCHPVYLESLRQDVPGLVEYLNEAAFGKDCVGERVWLDLSVTKFGDDHDRAAYVQVGDDPESTRYIAMRELIRFMDAR